MSLVINLLYLLCLVLGNPRWKENLYSHRHELSTDLAPVVDELLLILRKHISNTEYHDIYSTVNPMNKTNLLLESICKRAHNGLDIYLHFCDAVRVTKFFGLSQELMSYVD